MMPFPTLARLARNCRKYSRYWLLAVSLGLSTAAVAGIIMANFPLKDLMFSRTFTLQGYETFKGKVDGLVCKTNSKDTPNSHVVIAFKETIHPDYYYVDGRSGASTREKQLDEIFRKFKLGGTFVMTAINNTDISNTPITGSYAGHAKKINLTFDDPNAFLTLRSICTGKTEFEIATTAKGAKQFSASFTMSNSKRTGTLTVTSTLVEPGNLKNKGSYTAVLQAVLAE